MTFRLELFILVFTAFLSYYKLNRLKIPIITIIKLDYNYHALIWECYEIVSGIYISINLILYLNSSIWITEPDIHWIYLIVPALLSRILKYLMSCGIFGDEHQIRSH